VRALLFDLDDTLLDYSGGVDDSWAEACTTCCLPRGIELERLLPTLARSRRWFWDDPVRHRRERVDMLRAWTLIVAHALDELGVADAALAESTAVEFATRRRERMRLFPDALACLEAFRASGMPLGLVTNGDARQQRDKIERHGLAQFFDAIVIEGEFGAGKPDAVVYRHALSALGVRAEAAWMVGDNLEFDVDGPQRLGLRGVWLDRAGLGIPATTAIQPHRVIRTLAELSALRPPLSAARPGAESPLAGRTG
jgi:putative hydrolase of the HAD superfamily